MTSVLAAAPALPLHTAGPYVAAAYIAFVALILVYVGIMARKLSRTQRDLNELRRELDVDEELESPVRENQRARERAQERLA